MFTAYSRSHSNSKEFLLGLILVLAGALVGFGLWAIILMVGNIIGTQWVAFLSWGKAICVAAGSLIGSLFIRE